MSVRRKTTAVVGGLAGSALIIGMRLAIPASASEGPAAAEPLVTPTTSPPPSCCPTPSPTASLTPTATRKPPTATPKTPTGGPTTPPARCETFTGDAATITRPGVGAVTVTLAFCDKVLVRATSTQTQSNWAANARALKAMDTLTLAHYATNLSMIHFSGATLTSRAYQTSLKSALAKAGL